jgi:predicted XRE-type DNA-binding protein
LEKELNLLDPHKVSIGLPPVAQERSTARHHQDQRRKQMIRNEAEYQEAVLRVADERKRLKAQRAKLDELDLSQEEIKRVLDPMKSFHEQLKEEVASYERLQRGEFEELQNFGGLGRLLIALRISKGLSQRELAERLGVHESQVSRDERNEYHGVTVERANRILEGLGAEVTTRVSSTGGGSPSGKRDRVSA